MQPILRALTREFVQRGRVRLAVAMLIPGSLQIFLCLFVLGAGGSLEDCRRLMMHETVVFWSVVAAAFAVVPSLSDRICMLPTRLYAAPIATWALVAWKMLLGMVASAGIYLISALFCNLLVDTAFPLVAPALYVAAAIALLLATFWSLPDFSLWKLPLCGISSIALIIRWSAQYGNDATWMTVAVFDYAIILAAIAVAFLVAATTIARDRCGQSRSWPDLQHLYNRLTDRLTGQRAGFLTAEAAQFWYEWKPRGGIIPCLAAGLMLCVIVGITIHEHFSPEIRIHPEAISTILVLGGIVMPILGGLLAGMFIGDRALKRSRFDLYVATRPLSNISLARIVLQVVALSTLLTWIACLACAAVGLIALSLVGDVGNVCDWLGGEFCASQWQACGALVVMAAMWLGISLAAAAWTTILIATGRNWLFTVLALVIFGGPFVSMFIRLLDLPRWVLARCGSGLLLGFGSLAIGLATWAILSAWQQEAIRTRFVAFAAIVWVTALTAITIKGLPLTAANSAVFLLGLIALALMPPALASRAIGWNRHR